MYDVNQLVQEADCREVAKFIGMRLNGQYCECVSGLHKETQLNHCAIYHDRYHCFSCGEGGNAIRMVQQYYRNVMGTPVSFAEACKIVGDSCGGHEMFVVYGQQEKDPQLPFTQDELQAAGLDSPMAWWKQLWLENRQLCKTIVRERAKETLDKYREVLDAEGNRSVIGAALRAEAENRYAAAEKLYKACGGTEKRVRKMFKL